MYRFVLSELKASDGVPPEWLKSYIPLNQSEYAPCPWTSLKNFEASYRSSEMEALRKFLNREDTIFLQAAYIINRFEASRTIILETAKLDGNDVTHVEKMFAAMLKNPDLLEAGIDYTSFKGEGVNPEERHEHPDYARGAGWGLLQVLAEMQQPTLPEFRRSAEVVLRNRAEYSPSGMESRYIAGWTARLDTYMKDK